MSCSARERLSSPRRPDGRMKVKEFGRGQKLSQPSVEFHHAVWDCLLSTLASHSGSQGPKNRKLYCKQYTCVGSTICKGVVLDILGRLGIWPKKMVKKKKTHADKMVLKL